MTTPREPGARRRTWRIPLVAAALCLVGGLLLLPYHRRGREPLPFDPSRAEGPTFPLFKTEEDLAWPREGRPLLALDDTFEFQLGLGSGWHGLNLMKISADGTAVYEYQTYPGWSRKTFTVGRPGVERLVERINALKILGLHRAYHAHVADGTQWCLLIKTGGRRKAVYCDNYFPAEVRELATFVRRDLVDPASSKAAPVAVPAWACRQHEKEIWASLR
jgi:hypothetical protein